MAGHVVAMGGGRFLAGDDHSPLDDPLLQLAPVERPRDVFLDGTELREIVADMGGAHAHCTATDGSSPFRARLVR